MYHWSQGCLTSGTYCAGHSVRTRLILIPVSGTIDREGTDVVLCSSKGNQYVFMDHLTK